MAYPRILIISHNSLSLHSNNGKTLNSIFSSWPSNSICQIYFQDEIPESKQFINFFRIRDIDVLLNFFKRMLGISIQYCVQPQSRVLNHLEGASRWKLLVVNFLRKTNVLKLVLRDLIYGSGQWKTSELKSWLDANRPEQIFFLGGNSIFSFKIARSLAKQLGIPLNVYITDDYVVGDVDSSLSARQMRHRLKAEYRLTFSSARHVFVIGEDMANVFKNEFHRDFLVLMNSVSVPDIIPKLSSVMDARRTIKFVYAGGLHLGRDFQIVKFACLLRKISECHRLKFEFEVYSFSVLTDRISTLFSDNGVSFMGGISSDQLTHTLAASDFVLHVESFDSKFINLTRLSVSTKIPEYLISGACLVAYGPAELASIRLISNNNLGVVISDTGLDSGVADNLLHVIGNLSYRNMLIENGFKFAKKNFDTLSIQHKVLQLLKE